MDAQLGEHLPQGILSLVPHLVVVVILLLVGGVPQGQDAAVVGDVEVLIHVEDQIAHRGHLVLDLVGGDEQVGIVLAEVAGALDALQGAAGLKPEVVGHLADAHGQLAIGVGPVGVDHHVVGAVHGAQDKALVLHLHGGEHILLIVVPVAGGAVQVHGAHAGGHHVLIAQLALLLLDIVLQDLPHGIALGQEHGHTLAHQVAGHEQAQFAAQLPVVPALGLLQPLQIGIQLVLLGEGDAIDALQGLPVGVAPPIGGVAGEQLEGVALHPAGGVQVGAGAQVGELALLIEGDVGIAGQVLDELYLIGLVLLLHELDGLFPGQFKPLQLQLLLADLLHLGLDLGHVVGGEGEGGIHVVVPALLDRGADGQLHLGPQALDGLGHDVGAGVPIGLAVLLILKGKLLVFFSHVKFSFPGGSAAPGAKQKAPHPCVFQG